MRWVPRIDRFSSDLLIPGRTTDANGFILGDGVIEGLHGDIVPAVSVEAFRQAARRYEQVGLVPREDYEGIRADLRYAEEVIARLQAENDQLRATQEHIAGLRKAGFTVQKKTGRPPREEAANSGRSS